MDDEQIDLLARGICENLGLDPDERVMHGWGDDLTFSERGPEGSAVPGVALYSPRWQTFRAQAEMALAIQAALANTPTTPEGE